MKEIRGYLIVVQLNPGECGFYICPEKPPARKDGMALLWWCLQNCIEIDKDFNGKYVIIRDKKNKHGWNK